MIELTEYAKNVLRTHPAEVAKLLEGIGISDVTKLFGTYLSVETVTALIAAYQKGRSVSEKE